MRDGGPGTGGQGDSVRGRTSGVETATWSLDESPEVVESLFGMLSDDERARAAAFTRPDARRRFVVARGGLRERLGAKLGVAPSEIAFRYSPSGKPVVEGVEFNLAHSGELALLAISQEPIGIDLERRRPMKNASALARRWFHPDEVARIEAAHDPLAPDLLAEFFATWVAKEAALKLVGVGVGESLPQVLTPPGPGWATGLPPSAQGIDRCWVEPLEVAKGYAAAIATSGEPSAQVP